MADERTVKIDLATFDQWRRKKGYSEDDLAKAAGLSYKTITRVRKGKNPSTESAALIATALGLKYDELLFGVHPPIPDPEKPKKRRFEVIVTIDIPLKEMGVDRQNVNLALLRKVIGATDIIAVDRVRDGDPSQTLKMPEVDGLKIGKTALTLTMSESDIFRLLAAMLENELNVLCISKIFIPDHSWFLIIFMLLNLDDTRFAPQNIEDEALSEMLQVKHLEKVMHLKTVDCTLCKKIN